MSRARRVLGDRLAERGSWHACATDDPFDDVIDAMASRADATGLTVWASVAFGLTEQRARDALFGPVPAWPPIVPVDLDHMETR